MQTFKELGEAIRTSPDDALYLVYDHLDSLLEDCALDKAIPDLIQLIESNPDADFGNPGPIAHRCEADDSVLDVYIHELTASLRRAPNYNTMGMLTRLWQLSPRVHALVTAELRSIAEGPTEWSGVASEFLAQIESE